MTNKSDANVVSRSTVSKRFPDILAPFVPTPLDVVERMLGLANTASSDFVIDLGCGDGRIPITAARKYGARAHGVDVEPYWVTQSQANATLAGVQDLVTFQWQDAETVDLSPATVITLYLLEWSMERLEDRIRKYAKSGTRVISHSFSMKNWTPTRAEEFVDCQAKSHKLYLWIVD